ncbi:MAG: F0F1 ATP synthase subunit epsilon [Alphaproteobacteria bacterium]|nr:F0F1 ATP synthase subunit epsilon [Alphaproteobacteria bacterium]
MADRLQFELVSPERLLISRDVGMVVVPGAEGDFGVLPDHAPLISTVRPGVIDVYDDGATVSDRIFVSGGFAEVTGERCTVLAEQATPLGEIDRAATQAQLEQLQRDLAAAGEDGARERIAAQIDAVEAKLAAAG